MEGYAVESGVQETRRRLKRAGFKADNLDAMTEVIVGMEERLATKEDLAKAEGVLKQDIANLRDELQRDITNVRDELQRDITNVRDDLQRDIAEVRTELREELRERFEGFRQEIGGRMDGLKGQIDGLRWMIGLLLALTVPTLATLIALALR